MTIKTHLCNGYTSLYGKHFNPVECSVINSTTENLDQYSKPFSADRNSDEDSLNFSLSTASTGSSMIDEYHSTSEKITGETLWGAKLLPKNDNCRHIRSDNDWSLTYKRPGVVGSLTAPTLNTSWLGVGERTAGISGRAEENFDMEFSMDLVPQDYRRLMVPKSIDMYIPPPSPIYQNSPSPIENHFSDLQSIFPSSISPLRSIVGQGNGINSLEKTFDETTDGSFLFVTTNNVEKLQLLFHERGLEVQDIEKTRKPGVFVVLFKTHEFAKRAFTTQREIGIRMVPPKFSKRYWFKNPSPKFPVVFETTRRLSVKTGKSSSNVKIGDFLMMDARNGKGCLVLADQLKGRRMRIVGFIGKFMNINGRIIEQTSMTNQKIEGWISTKSHTTKQKFVLRRSMNKIEDYVYDDEFKLVENDY